MTCPRKPDPVDAVLVVLIVVLIAAAVGIFTYAALHAR